MVLATAIDSDFTTRGTMDSMIHSYMDIILDTLALDTMDTVASPGIMVAAGSLAATDTEAMDTHAYT